MQTALGCAAAQSARRSEALQKISTAVCECKTVRANAQKTSGPRFSATQMCVSVHTSSGEYNCSNPHRLTATATKDRLQDDGDVDGNGDDVKICCTSAHTLCAFEQV